MDALIQAITLRWEYRNNTINTPDSIAALRKGEMNELDQKLNASYKGVQLAMEGLTKHFTEIAKADSIKLSFLSWISIVSVIVVFIIIPFLIYRLQSGNDKMVETNKTKLNEESNRIETFTQFIEEVSKGNYQNSLIDATTEDADSMTKALLSMRDKLKDNAEVENKRNWTTAGLAQIGEILRANNTSSELFDQVIQFVVKYTHSNQGGLFLLNDDDDKDLYLELLSCYAYTRKKFMTKRISLGEGLVGQCFVEREKIILLKVPEDYINITSGLGDAVPNALLIVPLKVNEKIYGVLELASFRPYEDYEIDLVEKFADSIGATVSTVKVNERTRLLKLSQHLLHCRRQ